MFEAFNLDNRRPETNTAIIQGLLMKRTGLPAYTLYLKQGDHTVMWDSITGEVSTLHLSVVK